MKDEIVELLKKSLVEMGVTDVEPDVEIPEDPTHGDYSTNVALRLTKILKNLPAGRQGRPIDIALQVKEILEGKISQTTSKSRYQNIHKYSQKQSGKITATSGLQAIDHVEVVSPGFINFFLTEAKLSSQLQRVLSERESYGMSPRQKGGKRIVIEYTDPNPFKEFHVGHLYSNSVGESFARLLESAGNTVRRVNYQGDVGLHVAKAIWGLRKMIAGETPLSSIEKKSLNERVKILGQAYAAGATAYEENESAKKEIADINYLVFIAAQEYLVETQSWKPQVDYRQHVVVTEKKLKEVRKLYEKGRSWSLEYFEKLYRKLGTKFDGYYFESIAGEYGAKIVHEHITDGIFEKSEGAIVFRGEKYGLHTRVFINSLGLPTYEAKELGLAPTKYKDFHYDLSLIVTGKEIVEYFKVLIAAITAVNPELGKKTRHIGHGMVRLPEGKMSSRTGKVLTGEWLLGEVEKGIYDILQKSETKYNKEQQDLIAEKAAVAAVKYSLLKVALPSDIIFDIGKSVSFEGDSGPYLQYTYARCKSVLRKASRIAKKLEESTSNPLNPEEKSVARLISHFPEIVSVSAKNLTPNVLCSYLFKLTQAFNLFYAKHSILGEKSPFRLSLTRATAQVIKNGLYLLGIETLEQM